MRGLKKVCSLFLAVFAIAAFFPMLFSSSLQAQENKMEQLVMSKMPKLQEIAQAEMLVKAVREQNAENMSLDEIQKIDREWIAGGQLQFVQQLLASEPSVYLKIQIQKNKFLYTEAFLCDRNGAIVALFPKTSDYWQGDEEKFTACFNNGNGQLFMGKPEFDESSQTTTIQVSLPVEDQGETIGVLVVGLKSF